MSSHNKKHFIVIAFTTFVLALLNSPSVMAVRFAYPESKNLLENGSFERAGKDASDTVPHGWSQSYGTTSEVQTWMFGSSSPFGNKVLQLLDDSNTATVEIESDYIEIVPGGTYTVEGWIREYAPSTNEAYLYIKTYDTSKTVIDYVRTGNPGTAGWHKFSQSHRMPGHARYVKVTCRSSSDSWGAASGDDHVMRFDGIAFYQSEAGDLLYKDAFDLALSDQGCCTNQVPSGWVKMSGTSDPDDVEMLGGSPVKIVFDDYDDAGKIVIRSPYVYVAPGVDYTATVQSWIESGATGGQKGYLYLRFYDRHEEELETETEYYDASTTHGSYEQITVEARAPANAVYAAVILTTHLAGEGQVRMHSLSVSETYDQTRWVSPDGTSDYGTSANDPAKFNDITTFWAGVDSALESGDSVRVVFKTDTDGEQLDYEINSKAESLILDGIGSSSSRLLIEGESPYGARIVLTDNATENIGAFLAFKNLVQEVTPEVFEILEISENITLRNLVFQDLQTSGKPTNPCECKGAAEEDAEDDCLIEYSNNNHCIINLIGISSASDKPIGINSTSDIRIENISMQDLPNTQLAGIRPQLNYANLWIRDSDFIGIGLDHRTHALYPHWGRGLVISDNYSEDSHGAHFKLKGEITGVEVIDNEFVSTATGGYHEAAENEHKNFIYLNAAHSDEQPGWFGSGYHISGNHFDYRTNDGDERVAILIGHGGCNPEWEGDTRQHLLIPVQSDMINAFGSYGVDSQKYILKHNFHLDFDDHASIYIGDNTRLGYHSRDIEFRSMWNGSPPCTAGKTEVTGADISEVGDD